MCQIKRNYAKNIYNQIHLCICSKTLVILSLAFAINRYSRKCLSKKKKKRYSRKLDSQSFFSKCIVIYRSLTFLYTELL